MAQTNLFFLTFPLFAFCCNCVFEQHRVLRVTEFCLARTSALSVPRKVLLFTVCLTKVNTTLHAPAHEDVPSVPPLGTFHPRWPPAVHARSSPTRLRRRVPWRCGGRPLCCRLPHSSNNTHHYCMQGVYMETDILSHQRTGGERLQNTTAPIASSLRMRIPATALTRSPG